MLNKMAADKKSRNSSLELLRIICMVFIIFHHYVVHGQLEFNSGITFSELFVKSMSLFGKWACDVFMIITGYFMINSTFNLKKILKLVLKMFVYSIGILSIFVLFTDVHISTKTMIKQIFPIFWGNWFVIYYILLCIISPFLNKLLKSLNKSEYIKMLIILLIIYSVIPMFAIQSWSYSSLDTFIIMYSIGAFVKLWFDENIYKNRINLLIGLLFQVLIFMSGIGIIIIGKILNKEVILNHYNYFGKIDSILVIFSAIFIFLYFKNITFKNKFINIIAGTTLGIYIIHDNDLVRGKLWKSISPNINYCNTNYLIIHFLIKCIVVFVVCSIIDLVVEFILINTGYKLIEKIDFEKIKNKSMLILKKLKKS